eukprot:GHVS01070673.1.p1 GENE.GHVS01070673.1~~GHVS01070673.1.p1  ORF type:complete len:248 (+),score=51.57 GHVS01070673.1:30-773(+)
MMRGDEEKEKEEEERIWWEKEKEMAEAPSEATVDERKVGGTGGSGMRHWVMRQLLKLTTQKRTTDTDLHHIRDGLYVSSLSGAQNLGALRRHGITHIICVGPHSLPSWLLKTYAGQFSYKIMTFPDKPSVSLLPYLIACIDHIVLILEKPTATTDATTDDTEKKPLYIVVPPPYECRQSKPEGKVLVHCYAGHSRSVSICMGYLMRRHHINYDEALAVVRMARAEATPNPGFAAQLRKWQSDALGVL